MLMRWLRLFPAVIILAVLPACDASGPGSAFSPAAVCASPDSAATVRDIVRDSALREIGMLGATNVGAEVRRLGGSSDVTLALATFEGENAETGEIRCSAQLRLGSEGQQAPVAFTRKPAADGNGYVYEVQDTAPAAALLVAVASQTVYQRASETQAAAAAAAQAEAMAAAAPPSTTTTSTVGDADYADASMSTSTMTSGARSSEYGTAIYTGQLVGPRLTGDQEHYREFRTRLREGATQAVNFAGRYTIVEIGCGSGGCRFGYAIDRASGDIIDLPVGGEAYMYLQLDYRPTSRLMTARWTAMDDGGSPEGCRSQDWVLEGGRFRGGPVQEAGGGCLQ